MSATEAGELLKQKHGRPRSLFAAQIRALFLKNLSLESRQTKMIIFQVLPIFVIILIVGLLTVLHKDRPGAPSTNTLVPGFSPYTLNYPRNTSYGLYVYADPSGQAGTLHRSSDPTSGSGLLGGINQGTYSIHDRSFDTPLFSRFDTWEKALSNFSRVTESLESLRALSGSSSSYDCFYSKFDPAKQKECALYYALPIAGYSFDELAVDRGNVKLRYRVTAVDGESFLPYIDPPANSPYSAIALINSAFLRWMTNTSSSDTTSAGILMSALSGRYEELKTAYRGNLFGQFAMFAICFCLFIPFFVSRVVIERGSGLLEISKMSGLTPTSFWVSTALFDLIHYIAVFLLFTFIGLAFQFPLLHKGPLVLYVLIFSAAVPLITLSHFFAVFFSSLNKAVAFGYVWGVATAFTGILTNLFAFNGGVLPPLAYLLYPPFAYMRGIFVITHAIAEPTLVSMELAVTTAWFCVLYMLVFSVIFVVLSLYFDQVVGGSEGMRQPFYFPILWLISLWRCKDSSNSQVNTEDRNEDSQESGETAVDVQGKDIDVAQEEALVQRCRFDRQKTAVVIEGLVKRFPSSGKSFTAVDNVWLHIEHGECFGLLGPNGAGKTTLINMLVGLLSPTSGRATIGSHEITSRGKEIQRIIGLCPQFDLLYDDLTVEEHLLFYVRLKGYPRKNELAHVADLMNEVGLQAERRRLAKDLSGGQKRRLSIGIALTGDPLVVFLDEPSSGLDPGSRRSVWDVIRQSRSKRCFVLTTHSMEEAEVLCTRIGIVVNGSLQCLGNQQHLKSRFGQGFKIDVLCHSDQRDKARSFIESLVPKAHLMMSNEGFLSYQVPRDLKLSKVFVKIETQKKRHGIINWGISQANLEEVFLSIVKHAESASGDAGNSELPSNETSQVF